MVHFIVYIMLTLIFNIHIRYKYCSCLSKKNSCGRLREQIFSKMKYFKSKCIDYTLGPTQVSSDEHLQASLPVGTTKFDANYRR